MKVQREKLEFKLGDLVRFLNVINNNIEKSNLELNNKLNRLEQSNLEIKQEMDRIKLTNG